MIESLQFEGIIPVGYVVALPIRSRQQIEESIQNPMKDEQHLHLLPEVNLLMSDKLCLVIIPLHYPDKDEEG